MSRHPFIIVKRNWEVWDHRQKKGGVISWKKGWGVSTNTCLWGLSPKGVQRLKGTH